MTPRIQKKLRQPRSREPLHVTHRHAAGIDVHANVHWVAVPPGDAPPAPANHPPHLPAHVRSFGTCTADLMALVVARRPEDLVRPGSSRGPTKIRFAVHAARLL